MKEVTNNENPNFKSTKEAVMDCLTEKDNQQERSIHTPNGVFKNVRKKDWLSLRLTLSINLLVWEFIPCRDYTSFITKGTAFHWLCFTVLFKGPSIGYAYTLVKSNNKSNELLEDLKKQKPFNAHKNEASLVDDLQKRSELTNEEQSFKLAE